VFLLHAGRRLKAIGHGSSELRAQLFGIEVHEESLQGAEMVLRQAGIAADLRTSDFFRVPTPDELGCPLPLVDAVIGNPPFRRSGPTSF